MSAIATMRREFKRLMENGQHCAGDQWLIEVKKILFNEYKVDPNKAMPHQWLSAARKVTTKCDVCTNGIFYWGACVNGHMTNSARCFRCRGTGRQNVADHARNRTYDNHRKVV
jgi:hypothetical protein